MQWILKSENLFEAPQVYSRSDLFRMLYSDQMSLNDQIKLSNAFDNTWRPIYEWPEIFSPVTSISKGIKSFYKNRFIKAKVNFLSSLKVPEFFPLASFYLGIISAHDNDFNLAINYFENAQRLELIAPLCLNNQAVCMAFIGNWENALTKLNEISDVFANLNERVQLNKILISEMANPEDGPKVSPFPLKELSGNTKKYNESDLSADFLEPDLLSAISDDPAKHLLVFTKEFYNDFSIWSVKGFEEEKIRSLEADRSFAIHKATELFHNGNFHEALTICEELVGHKLLGETATQLKSKCKKELADQLRFQYRELVEDGKYSEAILWFIQMESRFPDFLDSDKEKEFLRIHEEETSAQHCKDILQPYIQIFSKKNKDYSIVKIKDVAVLIAFKEEMNDFLESYAVLLNSGHNYAMAVKKRVQNYFLVECIKKIKGFFRGILDPLHVQGKIKELIEKTLEYRNTYSGLLRELDFDLEQYINKAIEYYRKTINDMENGVSSLDSNSLINSYTAVADMRTRFPENDELKKIFNSLLDKLFSKEFFVSLSRRNVKYILSIVPDSDYPRIILLNDCYNALKEVDNIKDLFIKGGKEGESSFRDLSKRLYDLPTFNSPEIISKGTEANDIMELKKQLNKKVVSNLFELINFINQKRKYRLALEVMNILISRFRVQDLDSERDSIESALNMERSSRRKRDLLLQSNNFKGRYNKFDRLFTNEISSKEIEKIMTEAEGLIELMIGFGKEFPNSVNDLDRAADEIEKIHENLKTIFITSSLKALGALLKEKNDLFSFYQNASSLFQQFPEKCWQDVRFRLLLSTILYTSPKKHAPQRKTLLDLTGLGKSTQEIFILIELFFKNGISVQRKLEILNGIRAIDQNNSFVEIFTGKTILEIVEYDFKNKDCLQLKISMESDLDLLDGLLNYLNDESIRQYLPDNFKTIYNERIQTALNTFKKKLVTDTRRGWQKISETNEYIETLRKYRSFHSRLIDSDEYKIEFVAALNKHKENLSILDWQARLDNIGGEETILSKFSKKEFEKLIWFIKETQYHPEEKNRLLDLIQDEFGRIPDHVALKREYMEICEENGISILKWE